MRQPWWCLGYVTHENEWADVNKPGGGSRDCVWPLVGLFWFGMRWLTVVSSSDYNAYGCFHLPKGVNRINLLVLPSSGICPFCLPLLDEMSIQQQSCPSVGMAWHLTIYDQFDVVSNVYIYTRSAHSFHVVFLQFKKAFMKLFEYNDMNISFITTVLICQIKYFINNFFYQ